MTIGGQTHTATQAGITCSYAISPTSQNLSADAVTGTANVSAASGCAWTASSNAAWITIKGGASASGNGTVSYSVTANSATSSRSGTLTIAGQTFTVTQAGVSTCSVSLTTGGFNVSYASRQFSFPVSAASSCSWSTSANVPWISFVSGTTGSGNGTVTFSVNDNTGAARTGTIGINGSTLIVNQAGSTTCTYAISPTTSTPGAGGGSGSVNVTSASGCAWTAKSNASWISIGSGSSGTGNGSVTYTVQANTNAARNGTMTIAGNTFTVIQAGSTTCTYAISPATSTPGAGGGSGSVNVTSASGCAWTAASNASWITINSGSSGSGNGTVTYTVAANSATSSRSGTMTIGGQTHTATQAGTSPTCSVTLSAWGVNLGYASRQAPVQVYASSTCSWSASANVPWISFVSGATGSGNGTVFFAVGTNTGAARTGTVSINGSTVTVNQAGQAP